eukprot:COSAG01_NODE_362_length_18130_cov_34.672307_6_plen_110_part_00
MYCIHAKHARLKCVRNRGWTSWRLSTTGQETSERYVLSVAGLHSRTARSGSAVQPRGHLSLHAPHMRQMLTVVACCPCRCRQLLMRPSLVPLGSLEFLLQDELINSPWR